MSMTMTASRPGFFGWKVVAAAFVAAVFGWGVNFYGPPVLLHALHAARGWPVGLISAAVTAHFLLGAIVVARLEALYSRFGLPAVTRAGALATALGMLGWALAREPWQLFAATALSGAGWAATGGAAINAMIAPWFERRRAAALSLAYNGASVGGVLFSPLWVALILALGLPGATALIGAAMVATLWLLAGRIFARTPAMLGVAPDGEAATAPRPAAPQAPLPGGALFASRRFATLALATSLGLFAQIGLIAHLFSVLAAPLGPAMAGLASALATLCAVFGRTGLGWLLPAGADWRRAAAFNYAVQLAGSLALLAAGGSIALLLAGVVLFGLGLGNAASLPSVIAQREFAPADTGRVVALVTAFSQATYAFAPGAFGALRELAGDAPLFAGAALAQLAAVLVLLVGRRAARG